MKKKDYKKFVVHQKELSDCGAACLSTILNFYGGEISFEKLRDLTGTSKEGANMLGLFNAAIEIGLIPEGYELESTDELMEFDKPAIIQLKLNHNAYHYVVLFKKIGDRYLIGDPLKGLTLIEESSLNTLFENKITLAFGCTEKIYKEDKKHNTLWIKEIILEDIYPLISITLINVFMAALGFATAIFLQKLIDEILPGDDTRLLYIGICLLFVILIASSFLGYIKTRLILLQSNLFNSKLSNSLYDKIFKVKKSFLDSRTSGEVITRINDTRKINRTLVTLIGDIPIDILIIILTQILLFTYSWKVGILVSCMIPVSIYFYNFYNKRLKYLQNEVMQDYSYVESFLIDSLQGISTIKAELKESLFKNIYNNTYSKMLNSSLNLGVSSANYSFVISNITIIINVALIMVCSLLVLQNEIRVGEMMAIITISNLVLPAINSINSAHILLNEAKISFDRVQSFIDVSQTDNKTKISSENSPTPPRINTLAVENLSFRLPGKPLLLRNINITLRKGKLVTLIGESGGGKSTLLQILMKFYEPEGGNIILNDTSINLISSRQWRNLISYIPQEIKIFNGTLYENIALTQTACELENVKNFCKQIGIDKYFSKFPNSYHTTIGEMGINISGGQKQLIGVARALYKNPKILLIDEVTSNMDGDCENWFINKLNDIKSEKIILFASHKKNIALNSDYIYEIEAGEIKSEGEPIIFF